MANKSLLKSSIGRKFAMALSAMFLMIFLLQHFIINSISVFSPDGFNAVSAFMSVNNPFVQYLMQPILIFAVIYHFVMGFTLELQNNKARGTVKYAVTNNTNNSSWMSRNMVWSGAVILAFLLLHFYDFWVPTIADHYVVPVDNFGEGNYFMDHLQSKFVDPVRVLFYVISFVLLMMHLLHGFQSAFQSVGANHSKYTPFIKLFGKAFAIVIPVGFMIIAIYHYVSQL